MQKSLLCLFCVLLLLGATASAHPGRTDANGGHYNRSTGEYHYHHGYPEHQHPNGVCPYDFDDQTNHSPGASTDSPSDSTPSPAAALADPDEAYQSGYTAGMSDAKASADEDMKQRYQEGHDKGWAEGYNAGVTKHNLVTDAIICVLGVLLIAANIKWYYSFTARKKSLDARLIHENYRLSEEIRKLEIGQQQSKLRLASLSQRKVELEDELRGLKAQAAQMQRPALPQPEPAAKPEPMPRPKLLTFGCWPPDSHHTEGQLRRYQRAAIEPLRIEAIDGRFAVIHGSSGSIYHVTLNSCDCPDFQQNTRGSAPCKHIYFLALKLGIPVEELFK